MTNAEVAAVFEQVADLLEFKDENPFRVRAYRNAARAIRDLTESVTAIVADHEERLQTIAGIGKAVAEKVATLARTGHLPQLDELLAEIPESVLAIMRIPGIGPKKAAALYHQAGIKTLDELRQACEAGRVRQLKGFAAKTERAILDGLALASAAGQRLYWAEADQIAQAFRQHLRDAAALEQLEWAGSYRRGRETVGDLDLLAVADRPADVMDRFGQFPGVASVLARGDTKMSVRLSSGFQIDLRIVPRESFGAALQYFTGSKAHNVVLRGLAKQRGLKINEYGVFRVEGEQETYLARPRPRSTPRWICRAFRPNCAKRGASSIGPAPASCPNWFAGKTSAAICIRIRWRPTAATRSKRWSQPRGNAVCTTWPSPTTRNG